MTADSNRAREICSNALEINSLTAQDSYVTDACQGDLQLLSQVRALLAAHRDHSDSDFELNDSSADNLSRIQEQPGSQIGRYRLIKQIGKGGMGIVFLAEQKKPVSRLVALKIVKPGMDSQEVIARFHAEQQALALMNHPNIAQVFDAGITDSGRPYFVMEMVDGVPLTQFCDDNQLTIQARLKLFVTLCEAIQHAHQKGIIHRDLKPSNILVKMHAGQPVPKVIDFGIAKAMGFQLADRTTLTRTYQVVGTPLYMSPEQADCQGLFIDTRSDIYSLSVLLYELLAGKLPFENLKHQKHPVDEMLRLLREAEPAHPSQNYTQLTQETQDAARFRQSEPAKLYQAIRGDLDWIVMKGLEKDPARRYQTAMSLGDDIQRYFNNEPVLAGPPTTIYRVRKLLAKHKALITTALSFLLFLILGSVVSLNFAFQAQEAQKEEAAQRQQAELAEAKARQHLEKAHQAIEHMLVNVGGRGLADAPHMLVTRKKLLQAAIGMYQSLLEAEELNQATRYSLATTLNTLADVVRSMRELHELEPLHEESIALAEQLVSEYPREEKYYLLLSRSYVSLAWTSQKTNELERELHAYQKAQAVIERLLQVSPSAEYELVLALRSGQYASALHNSSPEQSILLLEQAITTYRAQYQTLGDDYKYRFALLLKMHGALLADRKQYVRSEDSLTRSIEMLDRLQQADPKVLQQKEVQINLAMGHLSLGDLYCSRNDPSAAIAQYLEMMKLTQKLSLNFPDYSRYATAYQDSIARINSALSGCSDLQLQNGLIQKLLKEFTPETAAEFCFRGSLYERVDDDLNAQIDHLKALDLEPDSMQALGWLAAYRVELRDYMGAKEYYEKLIQCQPGNAQHFYQRGTTLYRIKQYEEALADFSKAIELTDDQANYYFSRYRVFRAMRRYEEALADIESASKLVPENSDYRYETALTRKDLGQPQQALAELNRAIELNSQNPKYYFERFRLYRDQKQLTEAVTALEQATRLAPDNFDYHSEFYKLSMTLKNHHAALVHLSRMIELSPETGKNYYLRGDLYLKTFKEYTKALSDYNRGFELTPPDWKQCQNRAQANFHTGHYEVAVQDLIRAVELNPQEVSVLTCISPEEVLACPDKEFKEKMLKVTARLKELTPERGLGFACHAHLLAEYGYYDRLLPEIDSAVSVVENRIKHWQEDSDDDSEIGYRLYYVNKALLNKNQHELAQKVFDKSRKVLRKLCNYSPNRTYGERWLYSIYQLHAKHELEYGDESRALDLFSRSLEVYFLSPNKRSSTAWHLLLNPRSDQTLRQALQWAEEAMNIDPYSNSYRLTFSVAQYRSGRYQAAVEPIRQVLITPPHKRRKYMKDIHAYTPSESLIRKYLLAMSHYQLGDKQQAREFYNQAISSNHAISMDSKVIFFRAEAERTLDLPLTAVKPVTESDTQTMR